MPIMRTLHLVVGGLGIVLFVLTGQYMARVVGIENLGDTHRMLYRSLHIYLLGASAANVCIGCYMPLAKSPGLLRTLGSLAVLASAVLLAISFFVEATTVSLERPIASSGLYLLFGAAVLLLLAESIDRFRQRR